MGYGWLYQGILRLSNAVPAVWHSRLRHAGMHAWLLDSPARPRHIAEQVVGIFIASLTGFH